MLVIRRRAGESVLLGSGLEIEVQVIDISPTRVKLGITAPGEVMILRKEMHLTTEENLAAADAVTAEAIARLAEHLPPKDRQNPAA